MQIGLGLFLYFVPEKYWFDLDWDKMKTAAHSITGEVWCHPIIIETLHQYKVRDGTQYQMASLCRGGTVRVFLHCILWCCLLQRYCAWFLPHHQNCYEIHESWHSNIGLSLISLSRLCRYEVYRTMHNSILQGRRAARWLYNFAGPTKTM